MKKPEAVEGAGHGEQLAIAPPSLWQPSGNSFKPSSKRSPCPVYERTKDGDCRIFGSGSASQENSLQPEHRSKLRSSALSDQQISQLGWRTLPNGRLEIPYRRPDGSPEECHDGKPFRRWRLSEQELAAAKAKGERIVKYRSPSGNGCRLYHSALAMAAGRYEERLQDRFTPLRITEGELKTEAANAHDSERLTVGLGGLPP